MPGNASGSMDGIAVKPLTVGFHETQFLRKLNGENKFGFWFQLGDKERQQVGSPWGPSNPQALNRYSYVQNNPLKYTDPSGHYAIPLVLLPFIAIPVAPIVIGGAVVAGAAAAAYVATRPVSDTAVSSVGGAEGLPTSNEVTGPVVHEGRYSGDRRTAGQIINSDKRGGINSRFPGQWRNKTPDEIYEAARRGDPSARTAKKLLDSIEYDKEEKR